MAQRQVSAGAVDSGNWTLLYRLRSRLQAPRSAAAPPPAGLSEHDCASLLGYPNRDSAVRITDEAAGPSGRPA